MDPLLLCATANPCIPRGAEAKTPEVWENQAGLGFLAIALLSASALVLMGRCCDPPRSPDQGAAGEVPNLGRTGPMLAIWRTSLPVRLEGGEPVLW